MDFSTNLDAAMNVVIVLSGIINFFAAAFFWRMRATFVSQDDLKVLEAKLDKRLLERNREVDGEAEKIESRLRMTEVGIERVAGDIRNVGAIMTRVEHQVGLLVEFRMMESKPQ